MDRHRRPVARRFRRWANRSKRRVGSERRRCGVAFATTCVLAVLHFARRRPPRQWALTASLIRSCATATMADGAAANMKIFGRAVGIRRRMVEQSRRRAAWRRNHSRSHGESVSLAGRADGGRDEDAGSVSSRHHSRRHPARHRRSREILLANRYRATLRRRAFWTRRPLDLAIDRDGGGGGLIVRISIFSKYYCVCLHGGIASRFLTRLRRLQPGRCEMKKKAPGD